MLVLHDSLPSFYPSKASLRGEAPEPLLIFLSQDLAIRLQQISYAHAVD